MTRKNEIQEYFDKMKEVQKDLLDYIENKDNSDEDYQNLINYFKENRIKENKHELKATLRLISQIANDHHRTHNFFTKIEQVLLIFKKDLRNILSNRQIFHIFRSNKRLLLFLIEENIITPDKVIANCLTNYKISQACYLQYFYPNFKSYLDGKYATSESDSQTFEQKRKSGENDDPVCQMIRNDSVNDFMSHVKQNNVDLNSTVKPSIFETNAFLIDKTPSLIEYAAFFGSIEIIKFLESSEVKLTPSLWIYAIHSQKPELIHFLEEKKVLPEDESYRKCFIESLKCHHPEFTNYIQNNLISDPSKIDNKVLSNSIKFYNYAYFPKDVNNDFSIFYDLCKYDYFTIVQLLLRNIHLDINLRRILKIYCYLSNFKLFVILMAFYLYF